MNPCKAAIVEAATGLVNNDQLMGSGINKTAAAVCRFLPANCNNENGPSFFSPKQKVPLKGQYFWLIELLLLSHVYC